MIAMASEIISVLIVWSTVCSGADQRKHQSSASLAFPPVNGGLPSQRARNAENASIWLRRHAWASYYTLWVADIDDVYNIAFPQIKLSKLFEPKTLWQLKIVKLGQGRISFC